MKIAAGFILKKDCVWDNRSHASLEWLHFVQKSAFCLFSSLVLQINDCRILFFDKILSYSMDWQRTRPTGKFRMFKHDQTPKRIDCFSTFQQTVVKAKWQTPIAKNWDSWTRQGYLANFLVTWSSQRMTINWVRDYSIKTSSIEAWKRRKQ